MRTARRNLEGSSQKNEGARARRSLSSLFFSFFFLKQRERERQRLRIISSLFFIEMFIILYTRIILNLARIDRTEILDRMFPITESDLLVDDRYVPRAIKF